MNACRSWPDEPRDRAQPARLLALGLRALARRDPALEAAQVDAEQRRRGRAAAPRPPPASQRASSFGVRASPTSSASPSAASAWLSRSSAIRSASRAVVLDRRPRVEHRAVHEQRQVRVGGRPALERRGAHRGGERGDLPRPTSAGTPASAASRSLSASTAAGRRRRPREVEHLRRRHDVSVRHDDDRAARVTPSAARPRASAKEDPWRSGRRRRSGRATCRRRRDVQRRVRACSSGAYSFKSRFPEDDEGGTNPEELIAAAQASCYSMQLVGDARARAAHAGVGADRREGADPQAGRRASPSRGSSSSPSAACPASTTTASSRPREAAKEACLISKALGAVPEITLDARLESASRRAWRGRSARPAPSAPG